MNIFWLPLGLSSLTTLTSVYLAISNYDDGPVSLNSLRALANLERL